MNPFKDNTIERWCTARFKARIASAQKKYNEQMLILQREADRDHERVDNILESNKFQLACFLVEEVFGGNVKPL